MTLQFLKSIVAVLNLHENLRSQFLATLNLTKDERKKYAKGRLTPFSFDLSLEQIPLDEYKVLLIEKVPEIAMSLNLQEKLRQKKKEDHQLKKLSDQRKTLNTALSMHFSSFGNPVLIKTFRKLFPAFRDVMRIVTQAQKLNGERFDQEMLDIFEKFDKRPNIETLELVFLNINYGSDPAIKQVLDAIIGSLKNSDWCERDDKLLKTLIFSFVPNDYPNAYKKRFALWKYFQDTMADDRGGDIGGWSALSTTHACEIDRNYALNMCNSYTEALDVYNKHQKIIDQAKQLEYDF